MMDILKPWIPFTDILLSIIALGTRAWSGQCAWNLHESNSFLNNKLIQLALQWVSKLQEKSVPSQVVLFTNLLSAGKIIYVGS